jgi:hypothetical protein
LTLTATITPSPGTNLVRSDPEVRRGDYLRALTHWLAAPDPRLRRILFIENSGADLRPFREVAARSDKQVDLLSLPPNPLPAGVHYGYAELEMLDRAFRQSELRQGTTHMIKVTGRLIFPSLPRLLDRLPQNFRFAADARRNLPFRRVVGRGFVTTMLFLARHDLFDAILRKSYDSLQPSGRYPHFLENLVYERIIPLADGKDIFLRFPINCEPVGAPAHTMGRYDSRSRLLMTTARAISRVVVPKLWL